MVEASPALLHLVCQTLFVTCQHEADQLDTQTPDLAMQLSHVPQELARLQVCKRLLLAMQVGRDSMVLQPKHVRVSLFIAFPVEHFASQVPHVLPWSSGLRRHSELNVQAA